MGRPPKYKSEEERLAARRAQHNRSDQLKRRRKAGLSPLAPLYSTHAGERAARGKRTWDVVRQIRRDYADHGFTIDSLARRHRVSSRTISDIVRYVTWKE